MCHFQINWISISRQNHHLSVTPCLTDNTSVCPSKRKPMKTVMSLVFTWHNGWSDDPFKFKPQTLKRCNSTYMFELNRPRRAYWASVTLSYTWFVSWKGALHKPPHPNGTNRFSIQALLQRAHVRSNTSVLQGSWAREVMYRVSFKIILYSIQMGPSLKGCQLSNAHMQVSLLHPHVMLSFI